MSNPLLASFSASDPYVGFEDLRGNETPSRQLSVVLSFDTELLSYLDSLAGSAGSLSRRHVQMAKAVWQQLKEDLGPGLQLPVAQPTADGALQLAWDSGRHYVDLDILPDGRFDWFFRDRRSLEIDGTEEPEDKVGAAFLEKLRLTTSST